MKMEFQQTRGGNGSKASSEPSQISQKITMSTLVRGVQKEKKTLKNFKSVEFEPLKLKEDNLDEWVALTLTPDPLHINLLGGANDCIEKCESMYPIEMKSYFKRHCLNKAGEGPGGKFNGPSIKKVLVNLDDLQDTLPETAEPLVQFLRSTLKLHTMCVEEELRENFQEVLDEFEENFEIVYELF